MKFLMKNQRHHTRVRINSQPFNRYTRKRINIQQSQRETKCSLVLARLNEIPLMVSVKRIEKPIKNNYVFGQLVSSPLSKVL